MTVPGSCSILSAWARRVPSATSVGRCPARPAPFSPAATGTSSRPRRLTRGALCRSPRSGLARRYATRDSFRVRTPPNRRVIPLLPGSVLGRCPDLAPQGQQRDEAVNGQRDHRKDQNRLHDAHRRSLTDGAVRSPHRLATTRNASHRSSSHNHHPSCEVSCDHPFGVTPHRIQRHFGVPKAPFDAPTLFRETLSRSFHLYGYCTQL